MILIPLMLLDPYIMEATKASFLSLMLTSIRHARSPLLHFMFHSVQLLRDVGQLMRLLCQVSGHLAVLFLILRSHILYSGIIKDNVPYSETEDI